MRCFLAELLEAHGQWGNSWSKIAHHVPGRTQLQIRDRWRNLLGLRKKKGAQNPQQCRAAGQSYSTSTNAEWTPEEDQSKMLCRFVILCLFT
jgi:hypothetical protein